MTQPAQGQAPSQSPSQSPSPADLSKIPASRQIVSFRLGLHPSGQVVAMKARTEAGHVETLLLAAPVALHIRDRIRETLRARPGLAEVPKDDAFFAAQPVIEREDFSRETGHVGVPLGAHVETAPEGCILAFPLDAEGRHTGYRMSPLHAAYFLHAVNEAEESGGLKVLPKATAGAPDRAQPSRARRAPPPAHPALAGRGALSGARRGGAHRDWPRRRRPRPRRHCRSGRAPSAARS